MTIRKGYRLYIYQPCTYQHLATVSAPTMLECERIAEQHYPHVDYGWTYCPAFGFEFGLVKNPQAKQETPC